EESFSGLRVGVSVVSVMFSQFVRFNSLLCTRAVFGPGLQGGQSARGDDRLLRDAARRDGGMDGMLAAQGLGQLSRRQRCAYLYPRTGDPRQFSASVLRPVAGGHQDPDLAGPESRVDLLEPSDQLAGLAGQAQQF